MYLDLLTVEERRLFLELAWKAVNCDGEIADEEMLVMKSYVGECQTPDFTPTDVSLEDILPALSSSERSHKKIVLLELMGIWGADGEWRDEELRMMDDVAKALGIPDSRVNRLRRWAREFRQLLVDGYRLVTEE